VPVVLFLNSERNVLVVADDWPRQTELTGGNSLTLTYVKAVAREGRGDGVSSAIFGQGRRKGAGKRHIERFRILAWTPKRQMAIEFVNSCVQPNCGCITLLSPPKPRFRPATDCRYF
jgi:hypothetical protein